MYAKSDVNIWIYEQIHSHDPALDPNPPLNLNPHRNPGPGTRRNINFTPDVNPCANQNYNFNPTRNPNPDPDRNPAATPDPNPDNSTADCTHLYPRQDLNPSCNITPELDHCPTRNSYPYQNHAGDPVPNPDHNSTPNCTQDLYPGQDLN